MGEAEGGSGVEVGRSRRLEGDCGCCRWRGKGTGTVFRVSRGGHTMRPCGENCLRR